MSKPGRQFVSAVRGFSLIELAIAMVIIGIISAFAIPNYQTHMTKTRRADAKTALVRIAALEEKFFTECSHYATKTGTAQDCTADTIPTGTVTENGNYSILLQFPATCPSTSCYMIDATPIATKPQAKDGAFRITSKGERFWDKNNDGTFASTENSWD